MWKLLSPALLLGALAISSLPVRPTLETASPAPGTLQAPAADVPASRLATTVQNVTTNLADYPNGQIPQYAKLEIAFDITNSTASNPYFPYDSAPPPGVAGTTGITVNALLLPPGATHWSQAKTLPCFYYQPVQQAGSGDEATLLPVGGAEWHCRFSPESAGTWKYKLHTTDAGGSSETAVYEFECIPANRKGFVRVSPTDYRFFEFSDGTPLAMPLVSLEQDNPFNTLAGIRTNIQKLGESGIRFVRWFPTGEGANFFVGPFGDTLRIRWGFGDATLTTSDVDTLAGKKFGFRPYYYSAQNIPVLAGSRYRLTFRAQVAGQQVLRAQIGNLSGASIDICSASSTYHQSHGGVCHYRQDGWHDYSVEVVNPSNTTLAVAVRGLYVSSDAPSPYNLPQPGSLSIHSIRFQRDESGNRSWGPNLLTHSDPDTYNYVDQRAAANLDEILGLSEQYGVYHKLPLFHKNDEVLNRFLPDGSVGDWDESSRNFYSADGQASRWYQRAYARYFIARWSYSPALHSLELANENHLTQESYAAGFALADYVHNTSPRHILMSNSFWGYWVEVFWADPQRGHLLDYSDKHWYAREGSANPELVSAIWQDSAAYVRECRNRFQEYAAGFNYRKPIVRGEGGVWHSGFGQHPEIAQEPQGIYYHKKLWAHLGLLGYTCDGEWYPRLFVPYSQSQFPTDEADLFKMFAAYQNLVRGEPFNNGHFWEIGSDLAGSSTITLTNLVGNLRAWGVRDNNHALVWVDNAAHTWRNVVNGVAIPPASARLLIPGFQAGREYMVEWWDTYQSDPTQQVTARHKVTAQLDGSLAIIVTNLANDLALKILPGQAIYLPVILVSGMDRAGPGLATR